MRFPVLALFAALCMPAHAAVTLSLEPANPTPADTIVVTMRDSSPTCPTLAPTRIVSLPPSTIRIEYKPATNCASAPFSEAKAKLGPLPAGVYTVTLGRDTSDISPPPPPDVTTQLIVSFPAGSGTSAGPGGPLENYSGHYLTGPASGEGVFIEQYGLKSFLTYVTYDSEGRATWFVMPDARWTFDASHSRFGFAGTIYRTTRGEESPPSIRVIPVGTGAWYPSGFDTVILETTTDTSRTMTLRRYRF